MTTFSSAITYSLKHYSNGTARVYISNSQLLASVDFTASKSFETTYKPNRIEIRLCDSDVATNSVMKTERGGELLELRNKKVGTSFSSIVDKVKVTFKKGLLLITLLNSDQARRNRESAFVRKVLDREKIDYGSLYSGIGSLSLHIQKGLKSENIGVSNTLACDEDPLALAVNLHSNPIWEDSLERKVYAQDIY